MITIIRIVLLIVCAFGAVLLMSVITPDSADSLDHHLVRFNRFAIGFLVLRVCIFGLLFSVGWRFTNHYFMQHHALDLTRVRKRWAIFYLLIESVILLQILKGGG